ncbi:MAG: hypothetical protein ACR2RE_31145 [Geminicoccaceae bacterium]
MLPIYLFDSVPITPNTADHSVRIDALGFNPMLVMRSIQSMPTASQENGRIPPIQTFAAESN